MALLNLQHLKFVAFVNFVLSILRTELWQTVRRFDIYANIHDVLIF